MDGTIVPVILSGGSGTRLWPLSTDRHPKQFLELAGPQSMFAETLARIDNPACFAAPVIVGAARHAALMEAELLGDGWADAQIVLEPCARNTAPAIALAALAAGGGERLMLVMPSDHVIADLPAFHDAVDMAAEPARRGWLVTFSITPDGPETGYGYIRQGDEIAQCPGVRRVGKFIEKPAREAAEAMLAEGNHGWNAGIFLMRADAFLEALGRHAPAMLDAAQTAFRNASRTDRQIHVDEAAFAACPADSIDYAVMERHDRVATVPVACGWSDIGSWDALYALADKDGDGNALGGDALALDSHGNLVRGKGVTVSLSGVNDMIVIATPDHVMIVPRGRSQDVKKIVEARKTGKKMRNTPDS
ncbi:MAG: mannose-1-phosphate guanylyltransferase/mannose-6-phosphate isomerase [Blastomonas sp.]